MGTTITGVPSRSVQEVLAGLDGVPGWLTREQAERLWTAASRLAPGARVVEIGSYRGRSTIVLASAVPAGVEVIAIDPHGGTDRGPRQVRGAGEDGERDHAAFTANLAAAGVDGRVRHLRKPSQRATGDVPGPVDLVYVDGAHRYVPALADLHAWGGKVRDGGTLLVHDAFSSVGVTLALLSGPVFGGRFRYLGRSGSLAEYRRARLGPAERARNAGRQLGELGYFARNLLVKVMIVIGLGQATQWLGGTGEWPY
jgi:predicted O-methyltransferase YrrM